MQEVCVQNVTIGAGKPLVLIAGPCVIESRDLVMRIAEHIKKLTDELKIPYIFKSSYTKANRTSIGSFTGLGMQEGLNILQEVKDEFELPVLTDVHTAQEIPVAAETADIIQIPAFLCRQTELLLAAGSSGKIVNIKKGQFTAPWDMKNAADKVSSTGNNNILLTERGTTFGYNNLVVDFRSFMEMRKTGYPVIYDATHSLQKPSASGGVSGGQPEYVKQMSMAAAATGAVDGLFIETHPNTKEALSDAQSMLPMDQLKDLLTAVKKIEMMFYENNNQ